LKYNISYSIKSESNYNSGKSIAILMPIMRDDDSGFLGLDINYLKTIIDLTKSDSVSFNFSMDGSYMFILDLPPITDGISRVKKSFQPQAIIADKPEVNKVVDVETLKSTKQDLLDTIEALEILAESGNEDAKDTIEALKMLI
jgi:hypothetical protein